jgi:RNA polymerase sigma factor (sigma-70 family)
LLSQCRSGMIRLSFGPDPPNFFRLVVSEIWGVLRQSNREEEAEATTGKANRAQLDAINTAYRPALVSFFARRIRSAVEAEDLTQEVFMRLAGADLETVEKPEAYLFSIASNLLRDRARRQRVRDGIRNEMKQMPDLGIELLDPHRVAEGQDMLKALYAALDELPEKMRRIFILYRIENVAKKTIAAQFGLGESSIDKYVGRAMGLLIDRLGRDK